jgi:hypothetical protein
MGRGKKGKLSGAVRREINQRRATDAVSGKAQDIVFGRVTKLLGQNHIMVAIESKHGPKEIRVRMPNMFLKKGATPVTTREVVSVYVGPEFDPNDTIKPTDQFDITAILTVKQAGELVESGSLPRWMVHEETVTTGGGKSSTDHAGWEFGYSDSKGPLDEDSTDDEDGGAPVSKATAPTTKNQIKFGTNTHDDDDSDDDSSNKDIDVDAI